jgi:hypothetical protein
VLLAILVFTDVALSVCKLVVAVAIWEAVAKLARVPVAIGRDRRALAVRHALLPLALVAPTIRKPEGAVRRARKGRDKAGRGIAEQQQTLDRHRMHASRPQMTRETQRYIFISYTHRISWVPSIEVTTLDGFFPDDAMLFV